MSHKTLTVFALVGALSFPAHPGIAQEAPSLHQGQWPIQNGIKRQPTQNELRALHDRDVTPNVSVADDMSGLGSARSVR